MALERSWCVRTKPFCPKIPTLLTFVATMKLVLRDAFVISLEISAISWRELVVRLYWTLFSSSRVRMIDIPPLRIGCSGCMTLISSSACLVSVI